MIDAIHLWLAFVAASAILLAIPGPTILTVVSYSLSHGAGARLALVSAVALGDATALLISLVGLGALLSVSALWFTAVKWVGGLYLVLLGLRLFVAGWRDHGGSATLPPTGMHRLFFNTWLVTALNPKGIVFFVAFLPQFLDASRPIAPQLWLLSATFVVLAAINAGLYAAFAGAARELMIGGRVRRRLDMTGGALLIAAGLWALTARRLT
ncbi:MAG: LysE family translocator [Burkholderiaceae bacterium]